MSFTVKVNMFSIGRRKRDLEAAPVTLSAEPRSLRELIELCVEASVERQRRRAEATEPDRVTDEEVDEMARVGKIAFGIDYNGKLASYEAARVHALQAFEDGLFRVFRNDVELKEFDAPLVVHENDVFTFVRLVMLAGRTW